LLFHKYRVKFLKFRHTIQLLTPKPWDKVG
jgi:hypothetical protein